MSNLIFPNTKMALNNTAYSSPGIDHLCYVIFRTPPDEILKIFLQFFNKIWEESKKNVNF